MELFELGRKKDMTKRNLSRFLYIKKMLILKSDLQLVQNFINENGKDKVNQLDAEGFTPMHWAVYEGNVETVQ
jgi:ankyrin repeat protein